jgi:phosphoribosylformimino-5-aminoimidazole carboxamide ribotide isomerase
MLLVIPAIELTQGHCSRCIEGEPGTEGLYAELQDHPVELAQLWRRENAKCIHVTDADSFSGVHLPYMVETVIAMQQAVDIPLQFVSTQTNVDVYRELLQRGVYRVAINTLAWTQPDAVHDLLDDFGPSRVIFAVRAVDGDIDLGHGLGMINDEEFIAHVYELGGRRLVYSEAGWEGALSGQTPETVHRIARCSTMRITTAGGIASPQTLWALQKLGIPQFDSVVIGRALYENRFPCQQIWRITEAKLEPQIHAEVLAHGNNGLQGNVQSSISRL